MEKFMLILREDMNRLKKLTEEERFSNLPMMLRWIEGLIATGNYVQGEPLDIIGRYVSKNGVQSDGPFIESKEAVCGYDIVLAHDLDHAMDIAKTCPLVLQGLAVREVRPILSPAPLAFKS